MQRNSVDNDDNLRYHGVSESMEKMEQTRRKKGLSKGGVKGEKTYDAGENASGSQASNGSAEDESDRVRGRAAEG